METLPLDQRLAGDLDRSSLLQGLMGAPITMTCAEVANVRVGSWVEVQGKRYRVSKIVRSDDWFDATMTLHLEQPWRKPRVWFSQKMKVEWLEDELMPRVS